MSTSSSRTSSSQSQSTQTSNLNLQDTAGITVAGSKGVTINATDGGALNAALDISREAADLGRSAIELGNGVANAGLENAQSAYTGALDFGADIAKNGFDAWEGATDRVARFATDSLDANSSLAREVIQSQGANANRALDTVADSTAGVLDFASGLFGQAIKAQTDLTDTNLAGVTGLAKQVSQSATQSTNDAISKVATYALIAVAAIFVLPAIFKGAK